MAKRARRTKGVAGKVSKRRSAVPPPSQDSPPSVATTPVMPKPPSTRWGPDNPHPLSTMKTELVWEGKYDEWGNRRTVDVAGLAMPMQRIETIDQPRSEAIASGKHALFEKQTTRVDDFRNMLIWGENKLVMASLLRDFKGKIDLVYIDPPFDVGADFTMTVPIGEEEVVQKDQSAMEMVAYRDMWGRGRDSYLQMMAERLSVITQLLSPKGSIYVHVGPQVNHLVRSLLEDAFGAEYVHREIVWKRVSARAHGTFYPATHDSILFASRGPNPVWNQQFEPLDESYVADKYRFTDPDGRKYRKDNCLNQNTNRPNLRYEWNGHIRTWRWTKDKMQGLHDAGRLIYTKTGVPEYKRYLDESEGVALQSVWTDLRPLNSQAIEDSGYATQKPESLLERVIQASSNPGDVVADFFCGSGTTGAVAEKLGRRWIMADLGRFAVHTTRKRLIDVQRTLSAEGKPYRAFDLYNLGRYERQWWQQDALKGADTEHRRVVLEFFRAEVLDPTKSSSPLIHGRKGRALCHVDGIDSIFSAAEARAVAKAAAGMGATECYCLAWGFEMDIRQRIEKVAADLGVKLTLIPIPREIMEKNRKGPPPWLEVAVLEAEAVYRKEAAGGGVDIKLTKFLPSLAEVPTKELESIKQRAIKSGFDFIDFWAVDFQWDPSGNKPFNHHWQDYRTRKDRSLKTVSDAGHHYPAKGKYTACVKVVDVFGCDTSITVNIKV